MPLDSDRFYKLTVYELGTQSIFKRITPRNIIAYTIYVAHKGYRGLLIMFTSGVHGPFNSDSHPVHSTDQNFDSDSFTFVCI